MNRFRQVHLTLMLLILCALLGAQAPTATLNGQVADETGAVLPQATITVTGPDGGQTVVTSNQEGKFEVRGLAPGTYNVAAGARGFRNDEKSGIQMAPGERRTVNFALVVQAQEEKVEVAGEANRLDVGASSNASSVVITGKDLESLSDDPDELQSELQALAGPAAGPSGGQIYIDGFTGGQLPPKSAIREIRINQNPFSAQYDKLGYGRIEISTKPGSDHLHGQFFFNDNNAVLNSQNPYVPTKPSYNSNLFDGNLGGPLNRKSSFFLDAQRRNVQEFSAINATTADTSNIFHLAESIPNPRTRTNISPRIDYQISPSNTLTVRYQLTHDGDQNSGLTQFSLPSQAYNLNETEHTLQISDSQIISPRVLNETRFRFERDSNHQLPVSMGRTIQVEGAFTSGENGEGLVRSVQNNYELQNYTSVLAGKHLLKFGGRLRALSITDLNSANFNGSFVFSPVYDSSGNLLRTALQAYQAALAGNCSSTNYSPASCPTQFSIVTGLPGVQLNWHDAGLYVEDEWRARPNLSFIYGLRFESQDHIKDHADFAPRLGVAWGLGSNGKASPKTVLRAGFGIFYDRFGYNLVEQAARLNGITQTSTVVTDPEFFTSIPSPLPPASTSPTIYRISPELRAPYTIQSAASVERQITKSTTVSMTYLNSRGEHAFYLDNINAPAPFLNGGRPLAGQFGNDNIYQYSSGGVFRQNQLILNARINAGRRLSLFGFYTLSYARSNASSGGSAGGFFSSGIESSAGFLSNQYNPLADYGRAAFDVRHRAFIGGNISLPHFISLNPFLIVNSGQPYNLTTGLDNNGDSIFNDRPWYASGLSAACRSRSSFAVAPTASGQVPINYCTGPANATFNLRLSKTIGFGRESKSGSGQAAGHGPGGPRGGGPGGGLGPRGLSGGGNPFSLGANTNRRYNLTFSIAARNLLNRVNPAAPIGNLSSPLFGQSIALAGGPFSSASANRRVDLQIRFSF